MLPSLIGAQDAIPLVPAGSGQRSGCSLTDLFNTTAVPSVIEGAIPASTPEAAQKTGKMHGWLPLLTVLFLISYGLMTMLIVEQGATIESQRALIKELFRDSTELSAAKMRAQRERSLAGAQTADSPSAKMRAQNSQTPSTQVPLTQIPADQAAPSSQAAPQRSTKQTQKPQFRMPSKQASELIDDRRALISI
jgi:hypothetical protein